MGLRAPRKKNVGLPGSGQPRFGTLCVPIFESSRESRLQETGLLWTRFRFLQYRFRADVLLVEYDERGSIINDYY